MEYQLIINSMLDELAQSFRGLVLKDEPLKNHTYFKIGGPASIFAVPEDTEDLKTVLKLIKKYEIDYYIIGNGTNLLVSDEGFKGIIIKIGEKFNKLSREGNKVTQVQDCFYPPWQSILQRKAWEVLNLQEESPDVWEEQFR